MNHLLPCNFEAGGSFSILYSSETFKQASSFIEARNFARVMINDKMDPYIIANILIYVLTAGALYRSTILQLDSGRGFPLPALCLYVLVIACLNDKLPIWPNHSIANCCLRQVSITYFSTCHFGLEVHFAHYVQYIPSYSSQSVYCVRINYDLLVRE